MKEVKKKSRTRYKEWVKGQKWNGIKTVTVKFLLLKLSSLLKFKCQSENKVKRLTIERKPQKKQKEKNESNFNSFLFLYLIFCDEFFFFLLKEIKPKNGFTVFKPAFDDNRQIMEFVQVL